MSDALMILPAVTAPQSSAAPAPSAATVDAEKPAVDSATSTDSAEDAAQFSEVLACVVSALNPLPKQNIQLPGEISAESLVPAEEVETSRSLSLWSLVPTVPEGIETAEAQATGTQNIEFAVDAMRALNSEQDAVDISMIPAQSMQEAVGNAATEQASVAEQRLAEVTVLSDSGTDIGAPGVVAHASNAEPQDARPPRDAKGIADAALTPVAPKQTAASSERVVEAAVAQTKDEGVKDGAAVRVAGAEHMRAVVQTNASSTSEAKAAVPVADEMNAGPFGTLRPETSAPASSVSGRQALPDEKAETSGNDFTEAQRAVSLAAREAGSVDAGERDSDLKAAAASPARQVSEAVQTAHRNGVRVLELELKPEGMGTLRLRLSGPVHANSNDGQHIEIQALNPKAHALLLENMSELRSALGHWEIRLMPPVMSQNLNGVMAGSEGRGYAQSGSQRQNAQDQTDRQTQQEQTDESFAEQFGSSMNG